jgi:hypothetical protein
MTNAATAAIDSAVLASARARLPRVLASRVFENNYVAERRRAGARPGNRNAEKDGHFNREARARAATARVLRNVVRRSLALCRLLQNEPNNQAVLAALEQNRLLARACFFRTIAAWTAPNRALSAACNLAKEARTNGTVMAIEGAGTQFAANFARPGGYRDALRGVTNGPG